jgi:uncharacterized phage protein (TIGR02218 family)
VKTLPAGLQAHLDGGATTLCHCWKLERRDGAVLGFTDHDRPLAFDGVVFEPASGFTASAIESGLGLNVDNLAAFGALSDAGLIENDLAAGLYDDAEVTLWRVNWRDVAQRVILRRGAIGEVTRGRTVFEAELRGLAHRLNQPTGRVFQYPCDADLGDVRCTVDLDQPAFKSSGTVTAATDRRMFTASGLDGYTSGWFSRGKLTWDTGANAGFDAEVRIHAKAGAVTVELWAPMATSVLPGDGFTIRAGCDKQPETCKTRFGNLVNYRGFPHMPGNDWITSYPNRGKSNDGGPVVG